MQYPSNVGAVFSVFYLLQNNLLSAAVGSLTCIRRLHKDGSGFVSSEGLGTASTILSEYGEEMLGGTGEVQEGVRGRWWDHLESSCFHHFTTPPLMPCPYFDQVFPVMNESD